MLFAFWVYLPLRAGTDDDVDAATCQGLHLLTGLRLPSPRRWPWKEGALQVWVGPGARGWEVGMGEPTAVYSKGFSACCPTHPPCLPLSEDTLWTLGCSRHATFNAE